MSIHYLLDGYNLIHKMPPALSLGKLEDQRRYLVRFIERESPQGSLNNRVTIVFDGKDEFSGGMPSSRVKVIFSQGESADETIKRIVGDSRNSKGLVVVSDDREIQYAVRSLGARVKSVIDFLSAARGQDAPRRKSGIGGTVSEKKLSSADECKITAELGTLWLKTRASRK